MKRAEIKLHLTKGEVQEFTERRFQRVVEVLKTLATSTTETRPLDISKEGIAQTNILLGHAEFLSHLINDYAVLFQALVKLNEKS